MKNKFILFDFDGVIADSFRTAWEVEKMICPHLDEATYKSKFEGNVNDWEDPAGVHTSDCRTDLDFFDLYITKMKKEVRIFPGMEEIISALEKEYRMVVISSTITSPIKEFLEAHKLSSHFDWVMGNDVHKSKVEKVKMVFEKYGVTAKDCVFITDTLGDMREAQKMNVGAIGVTWGFQELETLQKGSPFRLVNAPAEIPATVSDYFDSLSSN